MKPETKFRLKINPKLKAIPNSWWESIQQKSIRATPDKIGCINGRFVSLEFKKDDKTPPDPLQKLKYDKIRRAKGHSFIVYPENFNEVYEQLLQLSELK